MSFDIITYQCYLTWHQPTAEFQILSDTCFTMFGKTYLLSEFILLLKL